MTKAQNTNSLKIGKKIFARTCSKCHGEKGDAQSEYNLQAKADKRFIYPYNLQKTLLTQEQIFLFTKYGAHFWGADKDDMPAWKKKYNDSEIKAVAKYIDEVIKP